MTLAEELAQKHYERDWMRLTVPPWPRDNVVAAINEAIERCAAECQKELSECEAVHDQRISWKRVAQRCESRIRDLKYKKREG